MHALVQIREDGTNTDVPCVAERIMISDAKNGYTNEAAYAVQLIDRLHKQEKPLSDLVIDRGYNFAKPERFHIPIRQAGMNLVFDLHRTDRGPKGTHEGALVVDGDLYCPALPKPFHHLEPPTVHAPRKTIEAFQTKIEIRRKYGFKKLARRPDKDGYMRMQCPAAAGKIRCPYQPKSLQLPFDKPTVSEPPAAKPKCCSQQTITVPPIVAIKPLARPQQPKQTKGHPYRVAFAGVQTPAGPSTTYSSSWCRHFCQHLVVEVGGIEPPSYEISAPASPSAAISEFSSQGTLLASFPRP